MTWHPTFTLIIIFWYVFCGPAIWLKHDEFDTNYEEFAYWLLTPIVAILWVGHQLPKLPAIVYKGTLAVITMLGEIQ